MLVTRLSGASKKNEGPGCFVALLAFLLQDCFKSEHILFEVQ